MARKTVLGLIDNRSEAEKAIEELLKSGFQKRDIGVISGEMINETGGRGIGATKGMAFYEFVIDVPDEADARRP
jgi:hypothetical protein